MQFPLQVRVWPPARPALERRIREFERRLAERIAMALREARARIDPDWVLGSIGWALLVYVIVHFGGAIT